MKILFFGQIRERLDVDQIQINEPISTLEELRELLCQRGELWRQTLQQKKVLMAVNQTLCQGGQQLNVDDEIAFFPPVTGG